MHINTSIHLGKYEREREIVCACVYVFESYLKFTEQHLLLVWNHGELKYRKRVNLQALKVKDVFQKGKVK